MPTIICSLVLFLAPLLSALPEEPIWSMILSTGLLAAAAVNALTGVRTARPELARTAVVAVPVLALASFLFHWLIARHGRPEYLDAMIRGSFFWLAAGSAFSIASGARSRSSIYGLILALTAGATLAAGTGLQDYLIHVTHHEAQWREFGTSTPDFFAGLLVATFPLALALFLGAKSGKGQIFWLPYSVALVLQLAVIPTTGSRFALVSIGIGAAVVLAALLTAVRSGLTFPEATKRRFAALAIIVLLGAAVVAKPTASRLGAATLKSQAHSGDFRVWTWKGTARLIESEPLLGAGPGMFVYAYPKFAFVGFTRHAHSAYLQTAADLGVPALLLLLSGIGLTGAGAFRSLSRSNEEAPLTEVRELGAPLVELVAQIELVDDRYLMAGLCGSLAAAVTQNLIDSDWYTFAGGAIMFSLLGVLFAVTHRQAPQGRPAPSQRVAAVGLATAAFVSAFLGFAAIEAQCGNFATASGVDPLNPDYHAHLASAVDAPAGNLVDEERQYRTACLLAPEATSFYRLGQLYWTEGRVLDALQEFRNGLAADPNSVQLLDAAAQATGRLGDFPGAFGYYQRMAALETSPYGEVRAIPEVSELRFVDGDAGVGDYLLARGQPAKALSYYDRAEADCEQYSAAGGASQPMRVAMNHGSVDAGLDAHMRSVYVDVMNNKAAAYASVGNAAQAEATKQTLQEKLTSFPGR